MPDPTSLHQEDTETLVGVFLPMEEEATLHTLYTLVLCSDATCVPVGNVSSDQAVLSTAAYHLVEVDVTKVMEEQSWADRLLHAELEGEGVEGLQPFLIERFAGEEGRGEVRLASGEEAAYGGQLEALGYFLVEEEEEEEEEFAADVGEEEWGEEEFAADVGEGEWGEVDEYFYSDYSDY